MMSFIFNVKMRFGIVPSYLGNDKNGSDFRYVTDGTASKRIPAGRVNNLIDFRDLLCEKKRKYLLIV